MSVKKFVSFEDARKELWIFNPDEKYYEHLKDLFRLWSRLSESKNKIKSKIDKGLKKGRR
jgi:hypothetical protein